VLRVTPADPAAIHRRERLAERPETGADAARPAGHPATPAWWPAGRASSLYCPAPLNVATCMTQVLFTGAVAL
jgi:hypothetical protein